MQDEGKPHSKHDLAQPYLFIISPPLTPGGPHRRWKRLAIFLLATVAVAGLLAFRWYRGGRNGLESSHGQHHDLQGGCHAPFNIDLWPQGQVPLTQPKYDKGGPFLTAYVPPGKLHLPSASPSHMLSPSFNSSFSFT